MVVEVAFNSWITKIRNSKMKSLRHKTVETTNEGRFDWASFYDLICFHGNLLRPRVLFLRHFNCICTIHCAILLLLARKNERAYD